MVLEHGRIVETGSFEELDQPGTRFRTLMQSQLYAAPEETGAEPVEVRTLEHKL